MTATVGAACRGSRSGEHHGNCGNHYNQSPCVNSKIPTVQRRKFRPDCHSEDICDIFQNVVHLYSKLIENRKNLLDIGTLAVTLKFFNDFLNAKNLKNWLDFGCFLEN